MLIFFYLLFIIHFRFFFLKNQIWLNEKQNKTEKGGQSADLFISLNFSCSWTTYTFDYWTNQKFIRILFDFKRIKIYWFEAAKEFDLILSDSIRIELSQKVTKCKNEITVPDNWSEISFLFFSFHSLFMPTMYSIPHSQQKKNLELFK